MSWSNPKSRPPLPSRRRISRECPPPPNVTSTYVPDGLMFSPSIVGSRSAGVWYVGMVTIRRISATKVTRIYETDKKFADVNQLKLKNISYPSLGGVKRRYSIYRWKSSQSLFCPGLWIIQVGTTIPADVTSLHFLQKLPLSSFWCFKFTEVHHHKYQHHWRLSFLFRSFFAPYPLLVRSILCSIFSYAALKIASACGNDDIFL